jgi:hypothetical protein
VIPATPEACWELSAVVSLSVCWSACEHPCGSHSRHPCISVVWGFKLGMCAPKTGAHCLPGPLFLCQGLSYIGPPALRLHLSACLLPACLPCGRICLSAHKAHRTLAVAVRARLWKAGFLPSGLCLSVRALGKLEFLPDEAAREAIVAQVEVLAPSFRPQVRRAAPLVFGFRAPLACGAQGSMRP